jgi:hypothetical protein
MMGEPIFQREAHDDRRQGSYEDQSHHASVFEHPDQILPKINEHRDQSPEVQHDIKRLQIGHG